jgi:glycine cleavage system H protein
MAHNIPAELKYTEEHEWVLIEGDTVAIGVTDFAQSSLGDIVFVEIPEVGTQLNKGDAFGVVESIKSVSDLYAPVSGEVIESNGELDSQPELCNSEPYTGAWMLKIKLSSHDELESLMTPDQYKQHCENQA